MAKKETALQEFHSSNRTAPSTWRSHGNYPLILFISVRGYITGPVEEKESRRGKEGPAPLWRFRAKPSARHSFAEEAKVANYRRRLNASHYDGSYSAPFLLDSRRGVKVYRPLRKSSGAAFQLPLAPLPSTSLPFYRSSASKDPRFISTPGIRFYFLHDSFYFFSTPLFFRFLFFSRIYSFKEISRVIFFFFQFFH